MVEADDPRELQFGHASGADRYGGTREPRPSDDLLSALDFDVWRVFVASSRLLVAELDRYLRQEDGIPHSWFIMLVVLSEQPARSARQSDLASITDFSLSRLSYAVDRLQEKGWLFRKPDPADRRAADIVLTQFGAESLLDIRRRHDMVLRGIFLDRLSADDKETLRRVCRGLLPGLRGASQDLAAGPQAVPKESAESRSSRS